MFFELKDARAVLGLSKDKFGLLVPSIFHLFFPKGGVQLFPIDYLKGLQEFCGDPSNTSIQTVRSYADLQVGTKARAISHIDRTIGQYNQALTEQPLTLIRLAELLCVPLERVGRWVTYAMLVPDTAEGAFSQECIEQNFQWVIPEA